MSIERSELTVRVYYEDTDFSGRVYHASYLRFLERGRTEWLRGGGFSHRDLATNSGIVFAVRSMQIEFSCSGADRRSLVCRDPRGDGAGASIEFRQRVILGEKALVAASVLVVAIRDGRPARLPAALRQALARPQGQGR